jgi:type I restriction enzyme, S subunit
MAKRFIDNHKLNMAINLLFNSLDYTIEYSIHDVIKLESGDYLPKHQMQKGIFLVYGGGGKTENYHSEFNIDFETIGIGRVGARCGCVFTIEKKSWVTDNALYVKEYDKRFILKYLKHFLNYSNLNQYANDSMQPVISKNGIQNVKIPLLPFEKQVELGEFIDELEKGNFKRVNDYPIIKNKFDILGKIENLKIEKQTQLLSQLRQSILQKAIQGKFTVEWREKNPNIEPATELLKRIKAERERLNKEKKFQKEKPLLPISENETHFELPQGWTWCRLGEIAQSLIGLTYKPTDIAEKGIPVLRSNNIQDNKLSLNDLVRVKSDVSSSKITKKNDILICVRNGSKKLIGKVALIDVDDFSFGAFMSVIRTNIDPTYLFYFLLSKTFRNQIDDEKSTGINQLTQGVLNNIMVVLPPFEEQQIIASKVKTLLEKCDQLQDEIGKMNRHSKELLRALFIKTFGGGN